MQVALLHGLSLGGFFALFSPGFPSFSVVNVDRGSESRLLHLSLTAAADGFVWRLEQKVEKIGTKIMRSPQTNLAIYMPLLNVVSTANDAYLLYLGPAGDCI